jgi:heat shock protein HslJ
MRHPTVLHRKYACAVIVTMLLASCATVDRPIPLPEGQWEMTTSSFNDSGRLPGLPRATLHIRDDRLSAQSGCNTANATVSSVDGRMVVSPLATTRRACPEPAGAFEGRYFKLLRGQPYFRIENGQLIIAGGDDSARFRRVTEKPAEKPAAKPQP